MHAIKSVILERSQVGDNWELPTNIEKKPPTFRGDRRKLPTSPEKLINNRIFSLFTMSVQHFENVFPGIVSVIIQGSRAFWDSHQLSAKFTG